MYVMVLTTFEDKKTAKKVANTIVDDGLGACVQIIGPMESVYMWQGVIETSQEYLCIIKTKKELYEELENTISEIHPYENPEIIAIDIQDGSDSYLKWIQQVTG